MKNLILVFAACTFITGTLLTSCNSPAEKVEKAKENVTEAKKDLAEANQEYKAEVENYRRETEVIITANDQSIADFRAKVAKEKK